MASTADRVLGLVALRQARRRAFNERLSLLDDGVAGGEARLFRCECGLIGCATTIKFSAEDFAALRAQPRRFAVHAEHVIPEAEQVVSTRHGHAIIQKRGDVPAVATVSSTRAIAPTRASSPDRSSTAGP